MGTRTRSDATMHEQWIQHEGVGVVELLVAHPAPCFPAREITLKSVCSRKLADIKRTLRANPAATYASVVLRPF